MNGAAEVQVRLEPRADEMAALLGQLVAIDFHGHFDVVPAQYRAQYRPERADGRSRFAGTRARIPAFAYGPGRLDVSHGPREYVDEAAMQRCAAVDALFTDKCQRSETSTDL